MSSQRLTEAEVHTACAELAAQGERPTALTLLGKLGRGSLSTISKHLNSWRSSADAQALNANTLPITVVLPQELEKIGDELLKKLWSLAKTLTDAELENQREALRQTELANQTKVEEAFAFSEAQTLKLERIEDESARLQVQLSQTQQALALSEQQQHELEKRNIALSKDLEHSQHQIETLEQSITLLETTAQKAQAERHQLIEQHTRTLQLKDHALSERDLIVQKLTTTLDMTKTENHSLKEALETAKNHAQDAEKQLAHVEGQLEVYRTVQPPHQD